MTTEPLDDEWRQRLQAAVEKTLAARAARAALRAELAGRRTAGLQERHAAKLARADERLRQAQRDGIHDSWWEEP